MRGVVVQFASAGGFQKCEWRPALKHDFFAVGFLERSLRLG